MKYLVSKRLTSIRPSKTIEFSFSSTIVASLLSTILLDASGSHSHLLHSGATHHSTTIDRCYGHSNDTIDFQGWLPGFSFYSNDRDVFCRPTVRSMHLGLRSLCSEPMGIVLVRQYHWLTEPSVSDTGRSWSNEQNDSSVGKSHWTPEKTFSGWKYEPWRWTSLF